MSTNAEESEWQSKYNRLACAVDISSQKMSQENKLKKFQRWNRT